MFLARKISRPKWEQNTALADGEIAADAISADLRTTENTLSFWTCDDDEEATLKEVVLALTANGDRVDKIDITWLAEDKVRAEGLQIAMTDGITIVARLVKRHRDIELLDLERLVKVARLIHAAVRGDHFRRLTKAEVTQVLVGAVENGDVQLEKMKEGLRSEVQSAIEKAAAKKR
jgi:serine phosphatase RsbU (regulator of sigma subunit)